MGRFGVAESFLSQPYLKFRSEIASILDPRTHSVEWLDAQIWYGRAKVWGDDRACLVTEVRSFPTGAFEVHVMVAAGSKRALVEEIIVDVERWATGIGALFVTIASRAAWARVMAPYGYEFWQQEIRKEV